MDYGLIIPEEVDSEMVDSVLTQDEAILDEQMQKFIKVSEEIRTLPGLIACAADKNLV